MFHPHTEPRQEAHTMPEREFAALVDDMVASLERPAAEIQNPKQPNGHNNPHDKQ